MKSRWWSQLKTVGPVSDSDTRRQEAVTAEVLACGSWSSLPSTGLFLSFTYYEVLTISLLTLTMCLWLLDLFIVAFYLEDYTYSSIDIFYMAYIHLLELSVRGLALWPSGLKPLTLLFPSPECWGYRQAPPHWPVFFWCGTRKTSTTQCFCPHNLQMLNAAMGPQTQSLNQGT